MYRAFEGEFPIQTHFDEVWFTIITATHVQDNERVIESILIRTDFSPTIDKRITSVEGINVARRVLNNIDDEQALDIAKMQAFQQVIEWKDRVCPTADDVSANLRDVTDALPTALEAVWNCGRSDTIMTSISYESPCPQLRALFNYVITAER
jgi:hypothetical protein